MAYKFIVYSHLVDFFVYICYPNGYKLLGVFLNERTKKYYSWKNA